eukprot:5634571-Lingulodinium_polyedra.AAC.1
MLLHGPRAPPRPVGGIGRLTITPGAGGGPPAGPGGPPASLAGDLPSGFRAGGRQALGRSAA